MLCDQFGQCRSTYPLELLFPSVCLFLCRCQLWISNIKKPECVSFILSFIPLKFSSTVLYNSVRHATLIHKIFYMYYFIKVWYTTSYQEIVQYRLAWKKLE